MGRTNDDFYIKGNIEARRGYLHIQLDAGKIDGKRNRKSVATGLKEKENRREANKAMDDLIDALSELHATTGEVSLHNLYMLHSGNEDAVLSKTTASNVISKPVAGGHLFSQCIRDYLKYAKTRVDENTYVKYVYASNHVIENTTIKCKKGFRQSCTIFLSLPRR